MRYLSIVSVAALGIVLAMPAGPLGRRRADPTWTKDVAPIVYNNCTTCHRPGGLGPFSLLDYDSAAAHVDEIKDAGHRFFGGVSMDLARVIEYAFQRAGRPNGYILGEEAGGAFIAGVRYGEGTLYTKDAGNQRVFWQGPSVGYDFGAEGSKTMVLVYDLYSPGEIFNTYPGVDGSAYFIGGVGITFLARDHVRLAPIRSGIGLRLGANVGYLKYTRQPTWNPF